MHTQGLTVISLSSPYSSADTESGVNFLIKSGRINYFWERLHCPPSHAQRLRASNHIREKEGAHQLLWQQLIPPISQLVSIFTCNHIVACLDDNEDDGDDGGSGVCCYIDFHLTNPRWFPAICLRCHVTDVPFANVLFPDIHNYSKSS